MRFDKGYVFQILGCLQTKIALQPLIAGIVPGRFIRVEQLLVLIPPKILAIKGIAFYRYYPHAVTQVDHADRFHVLAVLAVELAFDFGTVIIEIYMQGFGKFRINRIGLYAQHQRGGELGLYLASLRQVTFYLERLVGHGNFFSEGVDLLVCIFTGGQKQQHC